MVILDILHETPKSTSKRLTRRGLFPTTSRRLPRAWISCTGSHSDPSGHSWSTHYRGSGSWLRFKTVRWFDARVLVACVGFFVVVAAATIPCAEVPEECLTVTGASSLLSTPFFDHVREFRSPWDVDPVSVTKHRSWKNQRKKRKNPTGFFRCSYKILMSWLLSDGAQIWKKIYFLKLPGRKKILLRILWRKWNRILASWLFFNDAFCCPNFAYFLKRSLFS